MSDNAIEMSADEALKAIKEIIVNAWPRSHLVEIRCEPGCISAEVSSTFAQVTYKTSAR